MGDERVGAIPLGSGRAVYVFPSVPVIGVGSAGGQLLTTSASDRQVSQTDTPDDPSRTGTEMKTISKTTVYGTPAADPGDLH